MESERPVSSEKPGRTVAIIPSAGKGQRMGSKKKILIPLLDKPVIAHTLLAFENSTLIDSVMLVVPQGYVDICVEKIKNHFGLKKVMGVIPGGQERQDSVLEAIRAVKRGFDIIAVHDGARPLVDQRTIEDTVREAARWGAAVPVVEIKDTVKEVFGG